MKKLNLFLFVLCLTLVIVGCGKDEGFEFSGDFERSYSALQDFKQKSGNSYEYHVHMSYFSGTHTNTTITVVFGKVVQRSFKQGQIEPGPSGEPAYVITNEWVENENEVGLHQGTGAASPINLDEVYYLAKNNFLKKRDNVDFFFETDNAGMISTCGYVEKGCMDDCFRGISIASIKALSN